MEQPEVNIYTLKKGDFITRIEPIIESKSGREDYSFIGHKLKFLGIANGSIYFESITINNEFASLVTLLFGGAEKSKNEVIKLPIKLWESGWAYYVEPDFLDNVIDSSISNEDKPSFEKKLLKKQLDKAIANQEFEKAEELKRKIDNL